MKIISREEALKGAASILSVNLTDEKSIIRNVTLRAEKDMKSINTFLESLKHIKKPEYEVCAGEEDKKEAFEEGFNTAMKQMAILVKNSGMLDDIIDSNTNS